MDSVTLTPKGGDTIICKNLYLKQITLHGSILRKNSASILWTGGSSFGFTDLTKAKYLYLVTWYFTSQADNCDAAFASGPSEARADLQCH